MFIKPFPSGLQVISVPTSLFLLRNRAVLMYLCYFSLQQIEDRVKKLFAVWAEWSVFPALYLIGLQAMFYFAEADHSSMRAYVSAQLEQEQLDGESIISDNVGGANSSTSELDALRKKAKLCGVAYTGTTGKYELQYKLEYVERFAQARYGSSAAASISTLLLPTVAYSDSEDIDGVPLDSVDSSAGSVASTSVLDLYKDITAANYVAITHRSWGTVSASLAVNNLPDLVQYSMESWEWTIGRDYKDRVTGTVIYAVLHV